MWRHRRSSRASLIGGIAQTQQVLAFCAEYHLLPEGEVIPRQDLNKAYDKLLDQQVHLRGVSDRAANIALRN